MEYRISDAIVGDVFTHIEHGYDVTVVDRDSTFISLSNGYNITLCSVRDDNKMYTIKLRFNPKFKRGDVVLDRFGRQHFVIAAGSRMILQEMGSSYFVRGCRQEDYGLK